MVAGGGLALAAWSRCPVIGWGKSLAASCWGRRRGARSGAALLAGEYGPRRLYVRAAAQYRPGAFGELPFRVLVGGRLGDGADAVGEPGDRVAQARHEVAMIVLG